MNIQPQKPKTKNMTGTVLVALFAALTGAGCFIQIPLPGGIPIVIQDMMALLSGLLLGPLYGTLAICLFLVLGCIGLPVFSGKAGLHVIVQGPTGGFLAGYLLGACIGGLILHIALSGKQTRSPAYQWIMIALSALAAATVLFLCGIAGFMRVTQSGLAKTLAAVLIPFIPGTVIKLIVMTVLTKRFRPAIKNYIG